MKNRIFNQIFGLFVLIILFRPALSLADPESISLCDDPAQPHNATWEKYCGGGGNAGGGNPRSNEVRAESPKNLEMDAAASAFDNGDWINAIAHYRGALDYDPNNSSLIFNIAVAQFYEGNDAYKKADYSTAEYYFRESLKTRPNNAQGLRGLAFAENAQGSLAQDRGDLVTAESDYKLALIFKPDLHSALSNLAALYYNHGLEAYRKGDDATALNFFRQAVAKDPSDDSNNKDFRDMLANAQKRIDGQRQDAVVGNDTKKTIDDIANSNSTVRNTGDLSFDDPDLKDAVADSPMERKTKKGSMGSRVSDPSLEKADAPLGPEADTKAGDQALSAGHHGGEASATVQGGDLERAQHQASRVFDTAGENRGSIPAVAASNANDGDRVSDKYRKDREIIRIEKDENAAIKRQAELENKLKLIQDEKGNPEFDQGAVMVQESDIKNKLTRNKSVIYDEKRKKEDRVRELKRFDIDLVNGAAPRTDSTAPTK